MQNIYQYNIKFYNIIALLSVVPNWNNLIANNQRHALCIVNIVNISADMYGFRNPHQNKL